MAAKGVARGTMRLYALCLHLAIGASIWGYNIGILSSILVHPGWRQTMHYPNASERGTVTGVYYVGTLLSYLFFSHPLADWLGRRYAALVGTVVLAAGAGLMAGSQGLVAMGLGRWVCGLGVGIVSTTVPLYQSEISPAKQRGRYVTLNHVGFIAGMAVGLWVGYLMTYWTGPSGMAWAWRTSILLQLLPALVFATGLPFVPDTPRWLVEKGDMDKASKVLHWLREGTVSQESITHELHAIANDIDARSSLISASGSSASDAASPSSPASSRRKFIALSLSLFREPALRARLWRAFLLQFLAQMCGAAAMKYYLPSLLEALGLDNQLALMAGAVEMTIKIGMTVVEMWVIDRFGRRLCLVGGSLVMAVAMLINGALPLIYPKNISKPADVVCIVFIFIYAMGYSLGLGPAAWVYSSEIFPTTVRARGLNFAASGGSIGSILASHIWPVGIARLGSGVYFIFMLVNLACAPIVWFLYPETAGRALEDMDALFGKADVTRRAVNSNEEGVHLRGDRDSGEEEQSARESREEGARLLG